MDPYLVEQNQQRSMEGVTWGDADCSLASSTNLRLGSHSLCCCGKVYYYCSFNSAPTWLSHN